jgi:antitoxin component of MazEF toxin-antitoxin module
MRRTLSKHGNSFALLFEKSIMELLQIKPDTPLDMRTDGDVLTVTPVRTRRIEPDELKAHLAIAMDRFAPTLERLAK